MAEAVATKIAKLREQRKASIALLDQPEETGEGQISLTNPDARAMVAHGKVSIGYNAQVHYMALVTHDAHSRPGGRPSRQRAAEISDEIVSAAIDAFAEDGMDFSMDQVASAAGISKQAVYRRWPGKAELLVHALDGEVTRLVKEASEALPDQAEVALQEMAWRIFDIDMAKTNRISVFLQGEALRDPRLRCRLINWHEALIDLLGGQLRRVLAGAGKSPEGAPVLAAILLDLLSGARSALAWTEASTATARAVFDARWTVFVRVLQTADGCSQTAIASRPEPKSKNEP